MANPPYPARPGFIWMHETTSGQWREYPVGNTFTVVTQPPFATDRPILAEYTNWRGERSIRTFIPRRVFWGSNEWHPEPQVLIEAYDCEKEALRTFAASGFAKPASSPAGGDVVDQHALNAARKVYNETLESEWKCGATERIIRAYIAALSPSTSAATPPAPAQSGVESVEMLDSELVRRLVGWREKDEKFDRGTWHGISEIAGAVQRPKAGVRKELAELAAAGKIERWDAANGTFWRAALAAPATEGRS